MENQEFTPDLLELLSCPGFCVRDGRIVQANRAASQMLLGCGSELAPLLLTGGEEYAAFSGGCLYLTLQLGAAAHSASVTRQGIYDLFLLEPQQEAPELQAYALAAQALRQPLTALMTLPGSELLHTEDPRLQKQAALITRSLYQLMRLVGNMSDAYRYHNEPDGSPEMRDVTAVVDEIFQKLTLLCRKTGISIRFSNLPQPVYCLIDSEKLERGIYNILSNAIKAMPDGGSVRAALTRRRSQLYLTVQDSGSGIPAEQRSGVYRRYLRQPGLDQALNGIGLGMPLICAAAAAHGGTVLLESPEEGGTRITLTLSIRQAGSNTLRSPRLRVDYAGEWDHGLMELSDVLPDSLFREESEDF